MSWLAGYTYDDIAARFDIPRCRGLLPSGHRCPLDHKRGVIADGKVHWADRARVERAGIRRFLKLAAFLWHESEQEERPWARLYLSQRLIDHWASELGVRFPASYRQKDRLEVKAMLINVATDEPLREEAMAWAQTR